MSDEMVNFFKALADSSRLKIVGLLAQQPYTVEQLAAILNLKPPTISHHLSKLSEAGLVKMKTEGYYSVYELDKKALESSTKNIFSNQQMESMVSDINVDAFDQKIIKDFTRRDGSLKTIPAQRKKLDAVLRYVVQDFETGKEYSEKRVNEVLARFHEDTASLRRELVGSGLMKREGGGGNYWRV